ncbi:MAG: DUF4823 domain-containing protein [Alphaproteobacteria bacterium]|nr:DUF4823 domain-containing protein [Alphaproteobacteria bacterium]
MRILYVVVAMAMFLTSCTSVKTVDTTSASGLLKREGSALVGISEDGRYNATVYNGSGHLASSMVLTAFAPHLSKVEIGERWRDQDEALAAAREEGVTYLILPKIVHWEDRATAWSGIPDRATVLITVIDVAEGKTLDTATIDGRSAIMTLLSESPQDLLREPIRQYARQIAGG